MVAPVRQCRAGGGGELCHGGGCSGLSGCPCERAPCWGTAGDGAGGEGWALAWAEMALTWETSVEPSE